MAKFPAFPLWTDAYMADTSHLTDAEHGRYIMLLIFMWRAPAHRLPNDDDWLARKFNRTPELVRADLRPIIREFFKTSRHWITQSRLDKEFNWLLERSEKQARYAKSRWNNDKESVVATNSQHAPTPTPTPTPNKKEDSSSKPLKGDFEGFWISCPRKVGKRAAKLAYERALTRSAPETLAAGMSRYAATRAGQDERYTAHPATWLNRDGWLDEAISSAANTQMDPAAAKLAALRASEEPCLPVKLSQAA